MNANDRPHVFILGRAPDCDVVVDDVYASQQHAHVVVWPTGAVTVQDLGTTNGTSVRRQGIVHKVENRPVIILPGDEIKIGRTWVTWNGIDGIG